MDGNPIILKDRIGFDDLTEKLFDIDGVERQFGTGDVTIVEDVLNKPIHSGGGMNKAAEVVLASSVKFAGVFVSKIVAETLHRAERRSHVMSDAVGKSFEFCQSLTKFHGAFGNCCFE